MDWSLKQQGLAQQARCSECDTPLDGFSPHRDGCTKLGQYLANIQNSAQQYTAGRANAYANDLRNISLDEMLRSIPIPPEPRRMSWMDLLIEGLEADLRRFWCLCRKRLPFL
jgi:hypothetical protein